MKHRNLSAQPNWFFWSRCGCRAASLDFRFSLRESALFFGQCHFRVDFESCWNRARINLLTALFTLCICVVTDRKVDNPSLKVEVCRGSGSSDRAIITSRNKRPRYYVCGCIYIFYVNGCRRNYVLGVDRALPKPTELSDLRHIALGWVTQRLVHRSAPQACPYTPSGPETKRLDLARLRNSVRSRPGADRRRFRPRINYRPGDNPEYPEHSRRPWFVRKRHSPW